MFCLTEWCVYLLQVAQLSKIVNTVSCLLTNIWENTCIIVAYIVYALAVSDITLLARNE